MSSQLQNLTSQFNTLLNEYQDISKKYTDLVNKKNSTFTRVSNSSFFGKNSLSVLGNSNVSGCETACYNNKLCSGATFNKTLNNCTLSSGSGNIIPTTNSIAIVKQVIYYSNKLKELNIQLSILNQKIIHISNQSQNKALTKQEQVIMVHNHNILIEERKEIDSIMKQFQTLNVAHEDSSLIVNANYMSYIVFIFVVIFLTLLLLRVTMSSPGYGGGGMTLFVIFVIVFAIVIYIRNY